MKTNVPTVKGEKRYVHDLSHDVSTTSDFGFLQPILCREIQGKGSKVTIRPAQLVRMMPMVLPTFGRITLNTYNVFVPIESVYHPYGSLRAKQTYQGSNSRYVPDMVISASSALHSLILKLLSNVCVMKVTTPTMVTPEYIQYSPSNISVLPPSTTGAQEIDQAIQAWTSQVETFVFGASGILTNDWIRYRGFLNGPNLSQSDITNLKDTARYDWIDVVHGQSATYLVCGEYHIAAKNIRKVLYGCGYKCLWDQELLTFLPLLAYYKAWFDLFAPQREITWKDTNAAALQEWCEQNGSFNLCSSSSASYIRQRGAQLFEFYLDLAQCYYTQSPDFVSAHITGQATSTVANESRIFTAGDNSEQSFFLSEENGSYSLGDPTTTGISPRLTSLENINSTGLFLLRQLQLRRNAKSVIGGDIAEFMRTQLGTDYKEEDDSYWIGSSKVDISVQPVFSNAETEHGWLGQFAAQGSGASQGNKFTYVTKYDGYVISMITIVPESRFCQAIDMNLKHVRAVDFFDKAFDSYTLLPTAKKFIFAEQQLDNLQAPQNWSESFGNVPNFIEYCIAQNIQNGDMSLRSTRETYLPFTLDKLLPYTETREVDGLVRIENLRPSVVVNSTIWRYIGYFQWIGNYGRIFKNSGTVHPSIAQTALEEYNNIFYSKGYDDNIIIHNYVELKVSSLKVPVSDSFMLLPFDGPRSSVEMV